jgi:FkbM family methyltransferase
MTKNNFITCLADIPENQTCAIYGAGNGGQVLYQLIKTYRKDLTIKIFIDLNKEGYIDNIQIIHPKLYFEQSDNHLIFIATEWWYDVEQVLKENTYSHYLKIPHIFLIDDGLEILKAQAKNITPIDNTLFSLFFNGKENKDLTHKLRTVEELLIYREDKLLYKLLTCQNISQKECTKNITEFYFNHKPTKQYLDFINSKKIDTIIEGGVFNGKTSVDFIDIFGKSIKIYGFEPYMDFLKSSSYYSQLTSSNFKYIEKGLWSDEKTIYFHECSSRSYITESPNNDESSIRIDVTSLDKFVDENQINKIDFIKMDIEGAELEALKGAEKTIRHHRPQMAICIYHKKSDFYEIPLYLDSILDNYYYRLNHYKAGSSETVWYAIPNELENRV